MAESPLNRWGDTEDPSPTAGAKPNSSRTSRRGWAIAVIAVAILGAGSALLWLGSTQKVRGRAPGEFESCEALLLAWHDGLTDSQSQTLIEVIDTIRQHVKVYLLVPDQSQQRAATDMLEAARVPTSAVTFVHARVGAPWTRDYGPVVTRSRRGHYEMLDFIYAQSFHHPEANRQNEDRIPGKLAAALGMPSVHVPLVVDGGNLLCNGAGLCLTTERILDENPHYSREEVSELLRHYLGADQVLFLEPLVEERTRHVDVFCTFTSPDVVVVCQCDEKSDPLNFQILERNAQRLTDLMTPRGYLEVVRIPVPRRVRDGRWWTYTNVVYANGVLLVPSYPGVADGLNEQAIDLYGRLLPGWKVVGIDPTPFTQIGGALHCLTVNLAQVTR